jgi:hypothetical protein
MCYIDRAKWKLTRSPVILEVDRNAPHIDNLCGPRVRVRFPKATLRLEMVQKMAPGANTTPSSRDGGMRISGDPG